MSILLDGKVVSKSIKENIKIEVENLKQKYKKSPKLAVVLVGDNPASKIYVNSKIKLCASLGIESLSILKDENITEEELIKEIEKLNIDDSINGILVQLPLPKHINQNNVINKIPPIKDVDGLTKESVAKLILNEDTFIPCTPKGVYDILSYYDINVESKNVCIIGRSMLVGKPLSLLLTNKNATVTLCHSKTTNIKDITKRSDIVVCALGKARFLTKDMVNENTIVVDVGINRIEDKIIGDADFDNLYGYVKAITPVPGGCGVMTVTELMSNTIKAFKLMNE